MLRFVWKIALADLLEGIEDHLANNGSLLLDVWMSHGDKVTRSYPKASLLSLQQNQRLLLLCVTRLRHFYGVQFHPEVTHTKQGGRILERFVVDICGTEALWTSANIIADQIEKVRAQVGR